MTEASRTRRSYDAVAARYGAALSDELRHKPLDRALLDVIAESARDGVVADLGCGPGHVTAYLGERGVRAVGIDLSVAMLAQASTDQLFAAGDLSALPLASSSVDAIVCLYAVIHLDDDARSRAYAEFARVLRPGGSALVAFHVSDAETTRGAQRSVDDFFDAVVELTFRFLDPAGEIGRAQEAGLTLDARLDRAPYPDGEHASQRCYLLLGRPAG